MNPGTAPAHAPAPPHGPAHPQQCCGGARGAAGLRAALPSSPRRVEGTEAPPEQPSEQPSKQPFGRASEQPVGGRARAAHPKPSALGGPSEQPVGGPCARAALLCARGLQTCRLQASAEAARVRARAWCGLRLCSFGALAAPVLHPAAVPMRSFGALATPVLHPAAVPVRSRRCKSAEGPHPLSPVALPYCTSAQYLQQSLAALLAHAWVRYARGL
jgi:hypothetical protein